MNVVPLAVGFVRYIAILAAMGAVDRKTHLLQGVASGVNQTLPKYDL